MLSVLLTCVLMIGSLPLKTEAGLFRKAADTAGGVIGSIPFFDSHKQASTCNGVDQNCGHYLSHGVNGLPSVQELRTLCPGYKSFTNCAIQYNTRCHPNQPSANEIYRGQLSFMNELCDPTSNLRRTYAANIQCIKVVQRRGIETNPECRQYANTIYELFKDQYQTKGSQGERQSPNNNCMNAALSVSCQATAAQETCGSAAFDLLLKIAEDSKALEGACAPGEATESRGLFRSALDLAGKGASTIGRTADAGISAIGRAFSKVVP